VSKKAVIFKILFQGVGVQLGSNTDTNILLPVHSQVILLQKDTHDKYFAPVHPSAVNLPVTGVPKYQNFW
jgi:hypothetical protein